MTQVHEQTKLWAREQCDQILTALVGPALVERWWLSPNKQFNFLLPEQLWETEDWIKVYNYLKDQLNSEYS